MRRRAAFAIGFGAVVGLSLALTGSGGTAFAVLLLIYGLKLSPHCAVCVPLAAIGLSKGGDILIRTALAIEF